MKKRLGAVSAAMIDKAMPRECIHKVAMKYTCAICFKEFATLRMRRLKSHVEYDYEPALLALNPNPAPLLSMFHHQLYGTLTGMGADRDDDVGGTD